MSKVKCSLFENKQANCIVKKTGESKWNKHEVNDYKLRYCCSDYYQECVDFQDQMHRSSIHKGKVLIVDDEKSFVTILKRFFVDLGYVINSCTDGKTAVKLIQQDQPVMLLLDMNIPGMNGLKVLEKVKKKYPNMLVVVITGYKNEYKEQVEKYGVNAFFEKPVKLQSLKSTIEQLLSEQNATKSVKQELFDAPAASAETKVLYIAPDGDKKQFARQNVIYNQFQSNLENYKQMGKSFLIEKVTTKDELIITLKNFTPDLVCLAYHDVKENHAQIILDYLIEQEILSGEQLAICFHGVSVYEDKTMVLDETVQKNIDLISRTFDQMRFVVYLPKKQEK